MNTRCYHNHNDKLCSNNCGLKKVSKYAHCCTACRDNQNHTPNCLQRNGAILIVPLTFSDELNSMRKSVDVASNTYIMWYLHTMQTAITAAHPSIGKPHGNQFHLELIDAVNPQDLQRKAMTFSNCQNRKINIKDLGNWQIGEKSVKLNLGITIAGKVLHITIAYNASRFTPAEKTVLTNAIINCANNFNVPNQ